MAKGPRLLAYQTVYVDGATPREVLDRAVAAVGEIERLDSRIGVVGFHLEEYDAIGREEDGNGFHVTLTFDSAGLLEPDALAEIAKRI